MLIAKQKISCFVISQKLYHCLVKHINTHEPIMSNLEAVTKVADQIVARIFDQSQFTKGEINYLGGKLERELNLEGNFDRILKTNENVCLVSDLNKEDMCSAHDAKRRDISKQVTSLIERTEKILQFESDCRDRDERRLGDLRRELEQKRRACVADCSLQLEKLRESIMEEELDLERKYLKFEENLRNK